MSTGQLCSECSAEISTASPLGLCTKCLFSLGLSHNSADSPASLTQVDAASVLSPIAPSPSPLGKLRYFGDYKLLEEIARGGMGIVFKAQQVSLNRIVALKMIAAGQLASPALVQRFHAEAEAAANLDHPNIVPIYEIGQHGGQHYFSMKLIEGGSLAKVIEDGKSKREDSKDPFKPFSILHSPSSSAKLLATVARAVHYAHQRGILHRDLKPGNILLDHKNEPHVTDFGLAKVLEAESDLTRTATLIGTPSYMSPEQASGQAKQLTTSSDVFSLGAILYELLTGRPPFGGGTLAETLRQVADTEPRHPSTMNIAVDRDLETICLKCLEKDPARRYGSAESLATDLERWTKHEPILARRSNTWESMRKWVRRKPAIAGLTAAMILIAASGLAAVFWQWQQAEDARKLAEARALAEAQAKSNEEQERRNAQKAYAQVEESLGRLEIQKAEEFFRDDNASAGLAYLARVLRENPANELAARRIISTLTERSFLFPIAAPLTTNAANNVAAVKFSPDGRWIVAMLRDGIQVFDAETGKPVTAELRPGATSAQTQADLKEGEDRPQILFAEFCPDSRRILTGSSDKTARIWDFASRQVIGPPILRAGPVSYGQWSSDGRYILTLSITSHERRLQLSDAQTGQPVFRELPLSANDGGHFLRFTADGQRIFWIKQIGIQLWDYRSGELISRHVEHPNLKELSAIDVSLDGERLLTKLWSKCQVWDLRSGRLVAELPLGKSVWWGVSGRFSPDGQRVLIKAGDGTYRLWDAVVGQPLGEVIRQSPQSRWADFSPNGQWIITGPSDGSVRVWDGHSGRPVTEPMIMARDGPNQNAVYHAHLSAEGRRIITVGPGAAPSEPSVVNLWEIRTGFPRADGLDPSSTGDPSGRFLNTTNGRSNRGFPPAWLPELAEAVAGRQLTPQRALDPVPISARLSIRQRLREFSGEDFYTRWAKWFFADVGNRPVVPFSNISVQDYVRVRTRQNDLAGLLEAVRLSPTNGLVLAQFARFLLNQDPSENPRQAGEAEYYSRRGLELAPQEPIARSVRAEVLAANGKHMEALAMLEERTGSITPHPDLWNDKGILLENAERLDEAQQAFSKAIELADKAADWPFGKKAQYLLNRSDVSRARGQFEEAAIDFKSALALQASTRVQDWPAWGGLDPGRNMYSSATELPDQFDPGKLIAGIDDVDLRTTRNVKWVAKLGSQSYGNPTVAGGKVFIGTNNDTPRDPRHQGDRSVLMCLDEQNGGLLWQLVIPKLKAGKANDWEGLGLVSSPAIEGNRLYVASSRCEVLCLTTEGLARRNVGPFKDESQFVAGPDKPKAQVGRRDADIVWRYDMMDELGVFPHNATFTSPLIVGDLIYVSTCNGMDWTHNSIPSPSSPSLIAINKNTGELAGVDDAGIGPRIFQAQWGSPSAGSVNGKMLIFFGGGDGFCYAFDAQPVQEGDQRVLKKVWWADCNPPEYKMKNGEPIKYPHSEGPSEIIATPVFWKNRVYVAIGHDPEHGEGVGNLVCLDATKTGEITQTGVIWSFRGIHRSISTASITPEGLLFISDFSGFVHCLNAETGELFWKHDMRAHVWGSTLVADDKVYLGDEDGDLVILAASKVKRILSKTIIDGKEEDSPNFGNPIYSTPIVANGVIYIATTSHLFAIQRGLTAGTFANASGGLPY